MTPEVSIVTPVFNEIDCLDELYRRLSEVMDPSGYSWELILVDDGSQDGSTEKIRALAQEFEQIHAVIFARNFGHQIAVTAGLDRSHGQAVVIIDADLPAPGGNPRFNPEMERRLPGCFCCTGRT